MNLEESVKNYSGKKIKVSMEYLRKTNNFDFEPYRTIEYLIEKSKKLFFIVKEEIKMIHNNKDLAPFKEISIGEYFKNKNKIHLKLIQTSNNNIYDEYNIKSEKIKNLEKINKKSDAESLDLKYPEINPENVNINSDITNIDINLNSNTINNLTNGIRYSEISINNFNNENLSKKLNLSKIEDRYKEKEKNIIKKKENLLIDKSKFLCECNSNLLKTYFDREENTLICKNCRTDV